MFDEPEPEIPSPQERLRNAFSADIPQNVMERPEPAQPGHDAYARAEHDAFPAPSAVGHPVLRVVGVGGAGVNAVNRMVDARIPGVEFMAVNTDLQSLQLCVADVTVHIGDEQTRGLGAGADAAVGHRSAFEEQDKIKRLLKGSDMVFVAAGAGGGTGTGAAPVVARLAREVGALTVGIVTKPFTFEGNKRGSQAAKGIEELAAEVDTLIVVPNDRLLEVLDQQTSMVEAFQVADDVLRQGVQGISDLVTLPAVINLDFADVRTIMSDAGRALLGIGMAHGEGRAILAAEKAISSPLLETSMDGARSILLSITGGADLSLVEVSEAAKVVGEAAHPDANIIFGANVDEELSDQIWVTVVATRFDGRGAPRRSSAQVDAEPTIRRTKGMGRGRPPETGRGNGDTLGIDVPEFLPG
jgi:cell division protein FtsZ